MNHSTPSREKSEPASNKNSKEISPFKDDAANRPTPLLAWPSDAAPPVYPFISDLLPSTRLSPDPLRATTSNPSIANSARADLVCYALSPIRFDSTPPDAFTRSVENQTIRVNSAGELRLDFGVVSAGWIEFESSEVPASVQVSISEFNRPAEVNVGAQHPIKTLAPVRVAGDTWRLVLNDQFYEGVRFAWIHSPGGEHWTLRNIRLVGQARPANYLGDFQSDDPLLERIWEVGATTVRLNFLSDHMGAILMERSDRHSWTGDAHVSQAVAMPVFGNYQFVRANLDRTSGDTNGIEGYSLYWVLSLLDYVLCSGEIAALREYLPTVQAKLKRAAEVHGQKLPLAFCGHDDRTGGCFEEPEIPANQRFYRFLALGTTRKVRAALKWIDGDEETENLCQTVETRLLHEPLPAWKTLGLHDGSEAILAGEPPSREFLDREFGNPVTRVSYSPFNTYFVLEAMAEAGRLAEARGLLRRCWGGMIALEATTFWESFRPEWVQFLKPGDPPPDGTHGYTSLCHPWSAGPTRWLLDRELGLRPTAPGYAEFVFAPAPGAPHRISGTVATPHGPLRAGLDGCDGWLEIPEGCRGTVSTGAGPLTFEAGKHQIPHLRKIPSPVQTKEEAEVYPAQWLADARLGDSLPRATGWLAFAAHPEGGDENQIGEKTIIHCSDEQVHGQARREHFKSIARDDAFSGALRTRNPNVVQQTFTVDISRPAGDPYRLGIFCRDESGEGIIQTIDLLDLEFKTLIAPTRQVRNFSKGIVLWFSYDRGVRIRVAHYPGPDAILNGILIASVS